MGVLLVLKKGIDADQFAADYGRACLRYSSFPRIIRVEGEVAEFESDPRVESADPDDSIVSGHSQALPIGANLGGASWSIARLIRRKAPWPVGRLQFPLTTFFRSQRDGAGVDLYWLDTGIRETHSEFGGRVTRVFEAVSSGGVGDDNGHGTGTSSCGAGATVGLARAASIFSFKVLDSTNSGTAANLIAGLDAALSHHASRSSLNRPAAMNLSMGGFSNAINSAISSVIDAGIVVCATAGNTMQDIGAIDYFPAESDPEVIVVGGVGPADLVYYNAPLSGSNWGSRVDVSSPSQSIYRAGNASDSAFLTGSSGTSFGCGYVTGLVGCILQGHPRLATRTQVAAVRAHVIATATTGHLNSAFGITLPDRIAYLSPDIEAPEAIPGLMA